MSGEAKGPTRARVLIDSDDGSLIAVSTNENAHAGSGFVLVDYVRADILRRVVETRDKYDAIINSGMSDDGGLPGSRAAYAAWLDAMNEARKAVGK